MRWRLCRLSLLVFAFWSNAISALLLWFVWAWGQ